MSISNEEERDTHFAQKPAGMPHNDSTIEECVACARESVTAEYEVWQGDMCVASAYGTRKEAAAEAFYYALQYQEDGPVKIFEVSRKELTAEEFKQALGGR